MLWKVPKNPMSRGGRGQQLHFERCTHPIFWEESLPVGWCQLKLTPAQGLGTVVPCTLSIPGRWAGPAISGIQNSNEVRTLLHIITYYYISTNSLSSHYEGNIMALLFPVVSMEQIHSSNILVKRTGRCSCSGDAHYRKCSKFLA